VWLIPLADETQVLQVKLCYPLTMRAIPERLTLRVEALYKSTISAFTFSLLLMSLQNISQCTSQLFVAF